MKNILYYISFLAFGILIGSLFRLKGCSGGTGNTDNVVGTDTVFITVHNTDTLILTPKPKIIKQPIYVVDSSGFLVKDEQIERLSKYCDDVQEKLADAYIAIATGEQKQVELAKLIAANESVSLPVNHYEDSKTGKNTGVTAKVEFDVYGYLKDDKLTLTLNENETTIQATTTIDNTKKNAFGFTAAFRQQIGGNNQEINLRLHQRKNWFVYGAGIGSNVDQPEKPTSIEVFAGLEFGQKKK